MPRLQGLRERRWRSRASRNGRKAGALRTKDSIAQERLDPDPSGAVLWKWLEAYSSHYPLSMSG